MDTLIEFFDRLASLIGLVLLIPVLFTVVGYAVIWGVINYSVKIK